MLLRLLSKLHHSVFIDNGRLSVNFESGDQEKRSHFTVPWYSLHKLYILTHLLDSLHSDEFLKASFGHYYTCEGNFAI